MSEQELTGNQSDRVRAILEKVVDGFDIDGTVTIDEDDERIFANIAGGGCGQLIGRRAQTLDAIQLLTFLISGNGIEGQPKRVIVDADGYRAEREAELAAEADRVAQGVLKSGESAEMEPMTAQERRAVHTFLLDVTGVETHSEGEDPSRRIVISPVVG